MFVWTHKKQFWWHCQIVLAKLRKIFAPGSRKLIQKPWIFVKDFYPRSVPLEKWNAVLNTVFKFFCRCKKAFAQKPDNFFSKSGNDGKVSFFSNFFFNICCGHVKCGFRNSSETFTETNWFLSASISKMSINCIIFSEKSCTDELLLGIRKLMFFRTFWNNFAKSLNPSAHILKRK